MMRIGRFFQIVALILIAANAQPATTAFYQWSVTPSNNASADPTINWAEGMSPSSVNDSARAMMAALAVWRREVSGMNSVGGTSSALTLTSQTGWPSYAVMNQQMITFYNGITTNADGATLNIDGLGAQTIETANGVPIPAGTLAVGGVYTVTYYTVLSAFRLHSAPTNPSNNPYNVPLGGVIDSTISTPPNGNFVAAGGQCISTTTYAAYWAAIGSPASGGCPGGQFAVVDLRGRVKVTLDTINGSAAGRLTLSSGCGTAMTSMGATCAGSAEARAIALAQLPAGITSSGINMVSVRSTISNILSGGVSDNYTSVAGTGTFNSPTRSQITSTDNNTTNVTSTNTLGSPIATLDPNLAVYTYIRVL